LQNSDNESEEAKSAQNSASLGGAEIIRVKVGNICGASCRKKNIDILYNNILYNNIIYMAIEPINNKERVVGFKRSILST
jgi:hypothetical protein